MAHRHCRDHPKTAPAYAPRSTTSDDGREAAGRSVRRIPALERQGTMSLRERLAVRVATTRKNRLLLLGVYLADDLEHLVPGNRSRIEIALNFRTARAHEAVQLIFRFHPFGCGRHAEALRKPGYRADDRLAAIVFDQIANE